MATYAYLRVSTVEQSEGTSLDSQRRSVEGAAMMRGEAMAATFEDAGVSGSTPFAKRQAGADLLAQVQHGDVIIAAKLDRMFRDARDALNVADDLRERGVELVLLDLGTSSVTTNGIAKVVFTVLSAFAEFQRDRIRENQRDGIASKRANGGAVGHAPFGYRKVGSGRDARLEPDPAEQAIVARARTLRATGMAYRAIAAELGPVSRAGTELNPATVRSMIGG